MAAAPEEEAKRPAKASFFSLGPVSRVTASKPSFRVKPLPAIAATQFFAYDLHGRRLKRQPEDGPEWPGPKPRAHHHHAHQQQHKSAQGRPASAPLVAGGGGDRHRRPDPSEEKVDLITFEVAGGTGKDGSGSVNRGLAASSFARLLLTPRANIEGRLLGVRCQQGEGWEVMTRLAVRDIRKTGRPDMEALLDAIADVAGAGDDGGGGAGDDDDNGGYGGGERRFFRCGAAGGRRGIAGLLSILRARSCRDCVTVLQPSEEHDDNHDSSCGGGSSSSSSGSGGKNTSISHGFDSEETILEIQFALPCTHDTAPPPPEAAATASRALNLWGGGGGGKANEDVRSGSSDIRSSSSSSTSRSSSSSGGGGSKLTSALSKPAAAAAAHGESHDAIHHWGIVKAKGVVRPRRANESYVKLYRGLDGKYGLTVASRRTLAACFERAATAVLRRQRRGSKAHRRRRSAAVLRGKGGRRSGAHGAADQHDPASGWDLIASMKGDPALHHLLMLPAPREEGSSSSSSSSSGEGKERGRYDGQDNDHGSAVRRAYLEKTDGEKAPPNPTFHDVLDALGGTATVTMQGFLDLVTEELVFASYEIPGVRRPEPASATEVEYFEMFPNFAAAEASAGHVVIAHGGGKKPAAGEAIGDEDEEWDEDADGDEEGDEGNVSDSADSNDSSTNLIGSISGGNDSTTASMMHKHQQTKTSSSSKKKKNNNNNIKKPRRPSSAPMMQAGAEPVEVAESSKPLVAALLCKLAKAGVLAQLQEALRQYPGMVNAAKDSTMETALHAAVYGGHLHIATWLFREQGADDKALDELGRTPAALARELHAGSTLFSDRRFEHWAHIAGLLDHKIGLHRAAKDGNTLRLWYLIEVEKASPDAANAHGMRPLHFAVYSRHVDMVQGLLERGAKVFATNKAGETPEELAMRRSADLRGQLGAVAEELALGELGRPGIALDQEKVAQLKSYDAMVKLLSEAAAVEREKGPLRHVLALAGGGGGRSSTGKKAGAAHESKGKKEMTPAERRQVQSDARVTRVLRAHSSQEAYRNFYMKR